MNLESSMVSTRVRCQLAEKKLADESFERSDRLTKARVSGQKDQVPQLERDLAAIQKFRIV